MTRRVDIRRDAPQSAADPPPGGLPRQRGRHKQEPHQQQRRRTRPPRRARRQLHRGPSGRVAWRRRRLILLIGALAATVPATATGSDVTTILVPAAAGGTAVVTGRPAPTPANRALALTPSPAPAGSAADPRSSPTPSGPAGAGGSPPPSSAPRGSSTSAKVLGVQPVSYWQQRFDRSERGYFRAATELTTSSDSGDYYDAAYYVDAYVSMWQATDQSHYLDRAISLVENMVSRARPSSTLGSRYHDSYLGWVSRRSGVSGQEVPLYESYMWRYVTRMIRVMPRTGSYGTERARLLSFTERNIFDKWMSRGARTNVYRSRTHMAAHWAYIGLELSQTTGVPSATRAAAASFCAG